jgi:acyl transferase domain-containing protein/aryl carrier-like protein
MNNFEIADRPEEIAIIGMAGRFPQAKNIEQLWQKLRNGVELITFFTDDELRAEGATEEMLQDPAFVKAGGLMADIDLFDAGFFGYSPREAEILDPQHRNFLECSWEALENAGYDAERSSGLTGVFAGVSFNGYLLRNICSNPAIIDAMGTFLIGINSDKDFLATRVSYELNLTGPSMNIQTACSTSLVTVHVACQSLLNGECDMALAGGVSISLHNKMGYYYRAGGISSPDGHCRAFDAKGQGIVGGNGVGVVVLKRLSEALEAGDNIIAVIKGSTVNNDGSAKIGYTAPSIDGQSKAIAEALAIAAVNAESITYIEAHGTGTVLGDPIEVAALTQSFRATTQKKGFCAIGSVKTNLGHLDAAAGVTGVIKTALSLQNKMLPPSLHFEQPNPRIDFANSPFYVNAKLKVWEAGPTPRRAGVSSFGIGGTNAHAIMEEAPEVEPSGETRPSQLLLLSAKTPTALETMTANLAEHFKQNPGINLADAAFTLQLGRKVFDHRRALVCRDVAEAVNTLEALDPRRVLTSFQEDGSRAVVFMFSGQGTQYPNMSLDLYEHEPVFREWVDRCSEMLKPNLGTDLRDLLYPDHEEPAASEALKQTSVAQPALFVVEYALARLLMAWGVRPQMMIGHSIGEYVAACIAGVFSLADALALVTERGRLMQQMPAGAMLSIRLAEDDVLPFLRTGLNLAAVNAPAQCVVAGHAGAIDALQKQLTEQKVDCSRLHTSHAFHSEMMKPALAPFIEIVKKVKRNPPQIPFVSNVSGTRITDAEATEPEYWARHLRQTVRFAQGVHELLQEPNRIFVEIGPGQTLTALTRQQLNGRTAQQPVVPTLPPPNNNKSDEETLLGTVARLWLAGVQLDWSAFYANERRRRLPLPSYPFERRRYWIEPGKISPAGERHVALGKVADITQWFYSRLWKQTNLLESSAATVAEGREDWRLVFVAENSFSSSLVQRLKLEWPNLVCVRSGDHFEQLDNNYYKIDPQKRAHYESLLKALHQQNSIPKQIIHLWNAVLPRVTEEPVRDWFEAAQIQGCYSLLFLVQSLSRLNFNDALQLTVVSTGVEEIIGGESFSPEKTTVLAACKVIPQEYPHITCRSIDTDLASPDSVEGRELLDQLVAEFTVTSRDLVVAYRGRTRWIETFERLRLDVSASRSRLREGGVYLITGGLGRRGLLLATHLGRIARVKLVLTDHSSFPERLAWEEWLASHDKEDDVSRKVRQVKRIEELGAEIVVVIADVANRKQMESVIEQIYARFGQLNGVIHAAEQRDGFMQAIQETGLAHCRDQFRPKVQGLLVLEELLRDKQLDFCLLMSSLSTVLGGLGFFAAAAASTFMDAFASKQNREGSTPWISIDWDGWSLRHDVEDLVSHPDDTGIIATEAMEVLDRVLSHSLITPVVISAVDLQARISQWVKLESIRDKGQSEKENKPTGYPRPNLSSSYVAPTNETEASIAEIWQELLGIEEVGIHDNLFDLGGDSLLVIQIVSRIREILSIEVPLRAIFETPTIAELADSVGKSTLTRQGDNDEIATTLNLVEQLSDEELMSLLAEQEPA